MKTHEISKKFRQADKTVVSLVAAFGVFAQRHHVSRDGKRLPTQKFGFIERVDKEWVTTVKDLGT